jgi:hypothetical protein
MKRSLVSKKFLRNAAIVLAIAVVAYVAIYGVKEGFQDDNTKEESNNTVTKMAIYNTPANPGTIILEKKDFKPGVLKNIRFYVWGPATSDGGIGWKERTSELQEAWGLNTLLKTEFINTDGTLTNILPTFMQASETGAFLTGPSGKLEGAHQEKVINQANMDKAASIKISNLDKLNWGTSPGANNNGTHNLKIVYEFA